MARLKLGVLISGRGSNLQALLDAAAGPSFPAEVVLVLSNKAEAAGLDRARSAGVTADAISHKDFADREGFERALSERLERAGVELVCLAGFMRVLTPWFVDRWRDRLINIHPSLLPSFPGLDTHARALAAGVRIHGCTVHYVRAGVDDGPILVQAAVPVLPDDDETRLAARVLTAEHHCYPLAVRLIAENRVRLEGDHARVEADPAGETVLLNPAH